MKIFLKRKKKRKLSLREIIKLKKMSFELICGFLGYWGNPKVQKRFL